MHVEKASRVTQLRLQVGAVESVELAEDPEMKRVWTASQGRSSPT
jgi:hypothetical protein